MAKKRILKIALLSLSGLIIGLTSTYFIFIFAFTQNKQLMSPLVFFENLDFSQRKVIGFLPYWLISKASKDYSQYINTLTYFGLTVGSDGKIIQYTKPGEQEPGFYALKSGKADPFLDTAKRHNQKISLLVFSGNEDNISGIIKDPTLSGQNLIHDVKPIMQQYKFNDLNLDIESVKDASPEVRSNFTTFVKEVRKKMRENNLGTLTIDITGSSLTQSKLTDLKSLANYVDFVVLMAYDYHYIGSLVSGPVAPLSGAETVSDYDVQSSVNEALKIIPPQKLILGAPLYGYEWETIRDSTRSATIPSSGLTATTKRVEQFLNQCATCSAKTDTVAQEDYLIYKDDKTGTFHQIYYPNTRSMQSKVDLAKDKKLGGIALWALGYENSNILEPLKSFK